MATRFKYQSLSATGAAPSVTNLDGAQLDYDSAGGFGRLTASGANGSASRGLKLRTLNSGALVDAITITAAGQVTISADTTTLVVNAPTTYTAVRFNANGSAKGFVGADLGQALATGTTNGDMVVRSDGGQIHFTNTTVIRTTMASTGNWTMHADSTTLVLNAPTTHTTLRFNANGTAKGFLGADLGQAIATGSSNGDMVLRFEGSNLRFASSTTIIATLNSSGTLSGITSLIIGADIGTSYALRVNGKIIAASDELMRTTTSIIDGAGASAGTISNAPSAGNPTKWLKVNDNGTVRYVPAW